MNKFFKRVIYGGFIIGSALPMIAHASSLDFGTSSAALAETRIPISVKSDSQAVESVTLSCQTNVDAVDCGFEINGVGVTSNKSGKSVMVSYPNDQNVSKFPMNTSTQIGNIVLTNSSEVKYDNVNVTVTYKINDGSQETFSKVYIVNGKKPKSDDATLKSVTISQGSMNPTFNKDVFEYTIFDIADTINSIKFSTDCNDGSCEISYEGGKSRSSSTGKTSTITLNQGDNDIRITVKSESGKTTNVYTFKTIRGESAYNSPNLSKLSVGIYTMEPAFVANNYEYKITVPNKISSTAGLIEFTPVDSNAKVIVDDVTELKVGENIINLVVTNVLGDDAKTYKLIITRLSDDDIDVTAYLNNKVTFTNGDGIETILSFTDFELQYPDEAKKIEDGTYKFDDNGKRVHDEIVEDKKNDKSKKNKIVLIIVLVVIGLAIIAISGILLFRKKKTKLPKKIEEVNDKNSELEESKENEENNDEIVDETNIEEEIIGENFSKDKDATIDIDEALNDLMNTKQYELNKDEDNK